MVKRKNINDRWECSWDSGFKHFDVRVVAWHENHDHCNKKPSPYDHNWKKFKVNWHKF